MGRRQIRLTNDERKFLGLSELEPGHPDLRVPEPVAAERETAAVETPAPKARKVRPSLRYKAQYRYYNICVACRKWMQDNEPEAFRKICWKAGQRRPTYRIYKKKVRKEVV